jgi:integrase
VLAIIIHIQAREPRDATLQPVRGSGRHRVHRDKNIPAPPRSGFLEPEQYEKLLAALPDYLRPVLALGFYCGMRRSEVLGLRWEQVNFLSGTIVLLPGETKNDEGRNIPIVPQLRTVLMEQFAKRQPNCPYVCFRLDRRGHAAKIGTFRKVWQSRCIKLKFGRMEHAMDLVTGQTLYETPLKDHRNPMPKVKMVYRGLLYHDLRRSWVRNLVRAGVPENVCMKISGHLSRTVFDRYNISSVKDVLDAGEKLSSFLENFGDKTGTMTHQGAAADSPIN